MSRNGRLRHRPGLGPAAVLVAPAAPGWASRRPRCGIGPERYTDATLDPKPRRKTVNPGDKFTISDPMSEQGPAAVADSAYGNDKRHEAGTRCGQPLDKLLKGLPEPSASSGVRNSRRRAPVLHQNVVIAGYPV